MLMGGLVEGAALGTVFDLLFKSALETTPRVALFRDNFIRLKSTLCLVKLAMDEVDGFNLTLNRTQHETQIFAVRLLEGEKLIRKCSKVKRWNVFKRFYYSIKLSKLESSLMCFFQLDVAALHFRESKRISIVVSNLEDNINELTSLLSRTQIVPCCSNSFSKRMVGTPVVENDGNVGQIRSSLHL